MTASKYLYYIVLLNKCMLYLFPILLYVYAYLHYAMSRLLYVVRVLLLRGFEHIFPASRRSPVVRYMSGILQSSDYLSGDYYISVNLCTHYRDECV